MFQPLADIDANARQPGVQPSRLPGKARSPRVPSSTKDQPHRSPFRVTASGSPRYMAPKSSPMAGLSPSVGSKIPRKAGNATLPRRSQVGAFTISNTPRVTSLGGPPLEDKKTSAKGLSVAPKLGRSPPADRNKPLPSPPILQYVDPSSSSKAQRTLVDAKVAGTPTSEEWPILTPENIRPKKTSPMSTASSDCSTDKVLSKPTKPMKNVMANDSSRPATAPSNSTKCVSFAESQGTKTYDIITWESSQTVVHAITTDRDEALDSPLARKVAVPPRVSSKRTSLPTSIQDNQSSTIGTTLLATPRRHQSRSGSTMWPLLSEQDSQESPSATKPLIPKHGPEEDATGFDTASIVSHSDSESASAYSPIAPRQSSAKSSANGSVTSGHSSENNENSNTAIDKCIKRLSGHSTSSGLGPTLTIANDAASVILGPVEEHTSAQPVSQVASSSPVPEERSLSGLAGRISRQTISRMSMSIGSRSSTPQPVEEEKVTSTVKVFPIRSMQPPRKPSGDSQPRNCSSPLPLSSQHLSKNDESRFSSSYAKRSFPAAQVSSMPRNADDSKRASLRLRASMTGTKQHSKKKPSVEPQPIKTIQSKTSHSDATVRETSAAPRDNTTKSPAKPKRPAVGNVNTESSQGRPIHRSSRQLAIKDRTLTSSPRTPQATRVCSGGSSASIKSESGQSISPAPHLKALPRSESSARKANASLVDSKSESKPGSSLRSQGSKSPVGTREEKTVAKIKSKRSFRDFFHLRDAKRTDKAPKQAENKRSSLTATGNTLAKRIRQSATSSKPNTSRTPLSATSSTPEPHDAPLKSRTVAKNGRVKDQFSESVTDGPAANCTETAAVVNNIINQVSALPNSSPDRLRGLEIAEVCNILHMRYHMLQELVLTVKIKQALLNSVDAYKQAKISATKAKKHARQAELSAERAGVELERLQKLCEPDFDQETVQAIKEVVKCVGVIGQDENGSLLSGRSTPVQ